jgi:hypothetical protein
MSAIVNASGQVRRQATMKSMAVFGLLFVAVGAGGGQAGRYHN